MKEVPGGLYAELGVARNASAATITRAYRKKAQKVHPDKGGSVDAFAALQRAYNILSDEGKRAQYDATGKTDFNDRSATEAHEVILSMLLQLIDNEMVDIERSDLVELMRKASKQKIKHLEGEVTALQRKISKTERALKRLKRKSAGENLLAGSLLLNIEKLGRAVAAAQHAVTLGSLILLTLDDYLYQVDEDSFTASVPKSTWSTIFLGSPR